MPGVEEVEKEFYYPQHTDPRRLVPGGHGVYLDDVQRKQAEEARAEAEGRKPDLDNASAIAGTPLHTVDQLYPDGLAPRNVEPDAVLPVVVGEPEPDDEVKKAKDATLEAIEAAEHALEKVKKGAKSVPANDSASKRATPKKATAKKATAKKASK